MRVSEVAEKTIRAIERRCRGPQPEKIAHVITKLLRTGKVEEAKSLDRVSRSGCGYDFNETILKNPLDGKEHDYKCPKCGVTGSYRAPKF